MENTFSQTLVCKFCNQQVSEVDYFCPGCGKKLKDKPVSMGFWALFWLFILSTLLPPLGIGLTLRYIRSQDEKAKLVGWISLVITTMSLVLGIWLTQLALNSVNKLMQVQLQDYSF